MPLMSVELPQDLNDFVTNQIAAGHYANSNELFTTAIRNLEMHEQQQQTKVASLRQAIQAGIESGVAKGDVFRRIPGTNGLTREVR